MYICYHPNSVLASQNVAIFGPKILSVLKRCGKNFGGVFFDSFRQSEQESEKISALDALLAEITNWWALLVHDCMRYLDIQTPRHICQHVHINGFHCACLMYAISALKYKFSGFLTSGTIAACPSPQLCLSLI